MSFSNLTSSSSTATSRPKTHPNTNPSLQTQLTTLTSELELSTFLNKGILQSNSEYKIRIAELERENTILRAAEARLAEMEEMLEGVEEQCAGLERELGVKEGVERERDWWRGRWEGVRDGWEVLKKGMEEVCGEGASTSAADEDGRIGSVMGGSRRKSMARNVQPGERSTRKKLLSPSPPIPDYAPSTKGIAVKRKRVPNSPSEDPPEAPVPASRAKSKIVSKDEVAPISKRRLPVQAQVLASTNKQARPSRAVNRIGAVEVTPLRKIKVEQISPGDDEESDDDPLAMS